MPATQQDNDERWQMALDGLKEAGQQYQTLIRIVQNGFGTIGDRLDVYGRRIGAVEGEMKAVRSAEQECQQKLATLEADGKARALLMKAVVVAVVLLFIASLVQSALWWYVVTRLFNV